MSHAFPPLSQNPYRLSGSEYSRQDRHCHRCSLGCTRWLCFKRPVLIVWVCILYCSLDDHFVSTKGRNKVGDGSHHPVFAIVVATPSGLDSVIPTIFCLLAPKNTIISVVASPNMLEFSGPWSIFGTVAGQWWFLCAKVHLVAGHAKLRWNLHLKKMKNAKYWNNLIIVNNATLWNDVRFSGDEIKYSFNVIYAAWWLQTFWKIFKPCPHGSCRHESLKKILSR